MLSLMPIVYFVFAVFVVAGGAMGSKVSGTWHSITGSLAFGAVAVVAGILTRSQPKTGLIVGLIDAIAFIAFFIYRYTQTGKPMPAFPSIGLGVIVLVLSGIAFASLNRATV